VKPTDEELAEEIGYIRARRFTQLRGLRVGPGVSVIVR